MTTYSDARRAEATALAISLGPSGDKQASRQLGIPARTIRRWVYLVRKGDPRGEAIVASETREQVAERFWSVVSRGTERMVDALNDPKTPARDVARIVEVGFTSHSLMAGGPTSRTETRTYSPQAGDDGLEWWENALGGPLSDDERRYMRDSMDLVEAWLVKTLLTDMRKARAEGGDLVTLDPAGLTGQPWTAERVGSRMVRTIVEPPQITDGRNGQ